MIETMNAAETANYLREQGMRISPEMVRNGIEQGILPFGICIKSDKDNSRCFVFASRLRAWVDEISGRDTK